MVTDSYAYDAFGNTAHGLGSSPNPYQFNGQSNDGTGLYFLRARYYNPGDGRFLSQDPLMGSEADPASLHRSLYASGDPVNRMDPGGREDFSLSGVLAATGVASSLGGILDAAEFAIKDEFAAAAGVDISQERVIAATITGNLGLGNDWIEPIQQSLQNLEDALFVFQLGSHLADLGKAVAQVHGNPPFSKFANALATSDDELATLAGEDDGNQLTGNRSTQEEGLAIGCNNCLVAGSMILMADGTLKSVETIQPNDSVISRNPETGKTEPEFVMQTVSRKTSVLVTLTFTDPGSGKTAESMTCTPDHPIFVQSKGWVPAGVLLPKDVVVTRSGSSLIVWAVKWQRDEKHGFTVYNLTIEDDHNYFVGPVDGGIWVHNECILNRGGSYTDLNKNKDSDQVAHHMPQNAYSKTIGRSLGNGPALGMSKADHDLTRTFRSRGARTNRLEATLSGRERFDRDLLDIKLLFGDKYDQGLNEMLNYADNLSDLKGVKAFWKPLLR